MKITVYSMKMVGKDILLEDNKIWVIAMKFIRQWKKSYITEEKKQKKMHIKEGKS